MYWFPFRSNDGTNYDGKNTAHHSLNTELLRKHGNERSLPIDDDDDEEEIILTPATTEKRHSLFSHQFTDMNFQTPRTSLERVVIDKKEIVKSSPRESIRLLKHNSSKIVMQPIQTSFQPPPYSSASSIISSPKSFYTQQDDNEDSTTMMDSRISSSTFRSMSSPRPIVLESSNLGSINRSTISSRPIILESTTTSPSTPRVSTTDNTNPI